MEFLEILSPIAFVFALTAITQINFLKKEIELLKEEVDKLK